MNRLAEVAATVADAREGNSGRIEIGVGLDIPDPDFGTALQITADRAEEIALPLTLFVTNANELSTIAKAEHPWAEPSSSLRKTAA